MMRKDLAVRALHRGNMRVDVRVRDHVLSMDYPAMTGRQPTPLETLLASLAACAANTLALVLSKKTGIPAQALEVEASAERSPEHPTVLTAIELVYQLSGPALTPDIIDSSIRTAEEHLCPVYAMLRPGVTIHSRWELN